MFKGSKQDAIKQKIQNYMLEGYYIMQLEKQNSNKVMQNKTFNQRTCQDPVPEERSKYLLEMTYLFKDTAGILDLAPIKSIYSSIIQNKVVESESPLKSEERVDCTDSLDLFKLSDFKLCPSHQVLKIRENIYPSIKTETKCNCERCLQLGDVKDDVIYKCQPVIQLVPALMRTNECIDGVYRWKPVLEKNAVACICSQSSPRVELTAMENL